jgi:Tol biopolymer transport system component
MTAFDRFQRRIPGLLDELAPAADPDYLEDLLQRTAGARQRPAWSAPERWLPMGVIARTSILPRVPWRWLAIAAAVLLLAAAALLYAGSRRQQALPPPFGPARNGSILFGTDDGDIVSVDPVTNASTSVVAGPDKDTAPILSRDGTKFLFLRAAAGSDALFVANVDGSGVRELARGSFRSSLLDRSPVEWSPSGGQIAAVADVPSGMMRTITILATDGSTSRTLDLGLSVTDVTWRPNGRELVFKGVKDGTSGLYLVNVDGTGLRPIAPANNLDYGWREPVLSPDGNQVAFARSGSGSDDGIHIMSVDTGVDRLLAFEGSVDSEEYLPQFSPDGTTLAFQRYVGGVSQLVIAPAAGGGQPVAIGPVLPGGAADPVMGFSPDGSVLLVTYPTDGTTWLLGVAGGSDRQVSWPGTKFQSWQRLAP